MLNMHQNDMIEITNDEQHGFSQLDNVNDKNVDVTLAEIVEEQKINLKQKSKLITTIVLQENIQMISNRVQKEYVAKQNKGDSVATIEDCAKEKEKQEQKYSNKI